MNLHKLHTCWKGESESSLWLSEALSMTWSQPRFSLVMNQLWDMCFLYSSRLCRNPDLLRFTCVVDIIFLSFIFCHFGGFRMVFEDNLWCEGGGVCPFKCPAVTAVLLCCKQQLHALSTHRHDRQPKHLSPPLAVSHFNPTWVSFQPELWISV